MPSPAFRCIPAILLMILCHALPADAQTGGRSQIDSLMSALSAQKDDTSRVRLLNDLSLAFYSIDPAEGLRYGREGLALARKLRWAEGQADAHNKIGISYFMQAAFDRALQHQDSARSIYEHLKQPGNIARVSIGTGSIYQRQGRFPEAARQFNDALQRYTAIGDKRGMATAYGSLGNVFREQNDYSNSLQYQRKALSLFEQLPYRELLATNLKNIGKTYLDMAGDPNLRLPPAQYDSLMPLTRVQALQKAEEYLGLAVAAAGAGGHISVLPETFRLRSEIAELQGDHKGALEHYKAYKQAGDSVLGMEKKTSIARAEAVMQANQRQLQAVSAAKQRNEYIFLAAGGLFLIAVMILAKRRKRWQA